MTILGTVAADPDAKGGALRFPLRPHHLVTDAGAVSWRGPRLVVRATDGPLLAAGDEVAVAGSIDRGPATYRGDPAAGWFGADAMERLGGPAAPVMRLGNALRDRVRAGLAPWWPEPGAVLVAGFLTGDVGDLPEADAEDLRRAGLSHFVAVSGSNVALFLLGLALVLGPLAWGPRRRAVAGLAGLGVFVVATRWEPSVVRAATMAALALTGRLAGIAVDAWTALGTAVVVLVLVSPELAVDLGFQLSVAATAGVLAGATIFDGRRPRWAWTAAGATLAAQVAVAPILLARIGTVSAAAPLANPVAAPIVAAATALGGVGTLSGLDAVTAVAVRLGDLVLAVGRAAAPLPQLGAALVLAVGTAAVIGVRFPRTRVVLGLLAAGALGAAALPAGPPAGPEMTVLDVGQGDAILLRGPDGTVILVDGGPDPGVLAGALRARGIGRIDLVVASHEHADHTAALAAIAHRLDVRTLWHPGLPGDGGPLDRLAATVAARGGRVATPGPGTTVGVGPFTIEVLGPLRRYASPNDGSLVLVVRAAGSSVLLAGDIETFAQADLGPIRADVMKVPHQGAATSDHDWLRASAPRVAVISVGPNDFGHPDEAVIATLEEAGAVVLRTDRDGDVVVRLDRLDPPAAP
ncbi:MAG: ComEC/Rec2 family competence protein [Acidimicrobiia bacterium]|nr:ComEC/Rec2 family competence protein [Acidimicrobiia bacterium]